MSEVAFVGETASRCDKRLHLWFFGDEVARFGVGYELAADSDVQHLPFCPIVWKYLSYNSLTPEDILESDPEFNETINKVRRGETTAHWNLRDWNGSVVTLPSHSAASRVHPDDIDSYIREAIQFRLYSLQVALGPVREGFSKNTGLFNSPGVTGQILSHMAQGSPVLTARQLRRAAIINNPSEHPVVGHFWRSFDRLTLDQRQILFRRITGLVRVPRCSLSFTITVLPVEAISTSLSECALTLPECPNERTCHSMLISAICL